MKVLSVKQFPRCNNFSITMFYVANNHNPFHAWTHFKRFRIFIWENLLNFDCVNIRLVDGLTIKRHLKAIYKLFKMKALERRFFCESSADFIISSSINVFEITLNLFVYIFIVLPKLQREKLWNFTFSTWDRIRIISFHKIQRKMAFYHSCNLKEKLFMNYFPKLEGKTGISWYM